KRRLDVGFARRRRKTSAGAPFGARRARLVFSVVQPSNSSGGAMALAERFAGLSVAQVLEMQAAERPDSVFIIYGEKRLTYAQVDARSTALAAALAELGVEPGDRIAVDMPNWPEFIISMFAAA